MAAKAGAAKTKTPRVNTITTASAFMFLNKNINAEFMHGNILFFLSQSTAVLTGKLDSALGGFPSVL